MFFRLQREQRTGRELDCLLDMMKGRELVKHREHIMGVP